MKIRDESYKILSYKIKHNYNVDDFLLSYHSLQQRAIDITWKNIKWVEKWEMRYYIVESERK